MLWIKIASNETMARNGKLERIMKKVAISYWKVAPHADYE
jgi:hypothetical protein